VTSHAVALANASQNQDYVPEPDSWSRGPRHQYELKYWLNAARSSQIRGMVKIIVAIKLANLFDLAFTAASCRKGKPRQEQD
jgi:hypothetical protein